MAIIQLFVIFASFFGSDAKVRGGFIYTRRVGRVREVGVDEVSYLPEDGVVNHRFCRGDVLSPCIHKYVLFDSNTRAGGPRPYDCKFFNISSARSMRTTFSTTIRAATFSINSPVAPAAMAT